MSHYDSRLPPEGRPGSMPPQRAQLGNPSGGPGNFPQKWHLYQPGWTRQFKIGERQDAPLFAVVPHTGWFGRPRLTLHAGEGKKSDVVAAVKKPPPSLGGLANRHGFRIVFPGEEGMPEDVVDVKACLLSVGAAALRQHRSYRFTVKVGSGWERRAETFEWRYTHGKTVRVLREGRGDGGLRKAMNRIEGGWELVRLDSEVDFSQGPSGGEEVVAVWGEASVSLHKKASFAFLNSGATGRLGNRFANVAVISGMALWDEEQRQRHQRQATAAA